MVTEKEYLEACKKEGCYVIPHYEVVRTVTNLPLAVRIYCYLQISKNSDERTGCFIPSVGEFFEPKKESKEGENLGIR